MAARAWCMGVSMHEPGLLGRVGLLARRAYTWCSRAPGRHGCIMVSAWPCLAKG
ncbi:hypothetical protein TIFTF001_016498 [Ficus carica]|uniref:Uncharacterized protein n=1 Tax=Ficus carica TaxID=3494 RepID=A0AA88A0H0_FICCA|nr:hypothetical protein TIFTF001_016498 [Ficus carica]